MNTTIRKFGSYAALTAALLFTLALVLGLQLDFATQELLGYITIFASLIFVFFGIKHYRDKENNGSVRFGKALLIGILISLFASLAFGIIDAIYIKYINPDFAEDYLAYTLESMQNTMGPEEFQAQKTIMEQQMAAYSSPFFAGFIMFATVFVIGFVVSLLSALILQRK
ncbi:DUF4199 domain-containing protein [Ascidiimonas aurantiaca]|uniref:DUF4199 domain-containing protein n=1 Tax=Ascidiimonas aurantiaca TaxID=1685432 RepID=UPI0030EE1C21